jgi:hypothetical protein
VKEAFDVRRHGYEPSVRREQAATFLKEPYRIWDMLEDVARYHRVEVRVRPACVLQRAAIDRKVVALSRKRRSGRIDFLTLHLPAPLA